MNNFRSQGKRRSDGPTRQDSGFSIRKETISAPIPHPDDDEFPIRTPGTGIATPLGAEAHERQLRLRESPVIEEYDTPDQSGIAAADFVDPTPATQATSIPSQPAIESPSQDVEQPNTVRPSIGSLPSRASVGKPQRKKSSLRSVLGKLFGRKRKGSASPHSRRTDSSDLRASQHRSDPTALERNPITKTSSQQRSASLPVNEFNRALRSHSIVAEDFPLRGSTYEPNRDSIQANGTIRQRRATNPSRLWEPDKPAGYVDWAGLSPRPASIHARGSRIVSDAEADEAVGIAVSSGSHPNRRSRSLGELKGGAPYNSVTRRRSDEIRYWRESYDQGILSPMSSNKPDIDEEPIVVDLPENVQENEAYEQPQPFNFGPMGEMAGMKITQAASLETRVMQLEDCMLKIERTISRIQYNTSSEAIQFQDPPLRNPNRNIKPPVLRPTSGTSELSLPKHQAHRGSPQRPGRQVASLPGSQLRSSSYGSSRPSTMSNNNSYHPSFDTFPPPIFSTVNETLSSSQNTARPLSTSTTIRGLPSSSPTIPKDGTLTAEHYTALTNMILAEQAARQNLESVVRSLQQQLQTVVASTSTSHHSQHGEFSNFGRDDSDDDEARFTEDFQTPNEERGHFGHEIFGDVLNNSGDVKNAPRTLSLSQITLGKGPQQQSVKF